VGGLFQWDARMARRLSQFGGMSEIGAKADIAALRADVG
jgi:hypothetical protein